MFSACIYVERATQEKEGKCENVYFVCVGC